MPTSPASGQSDDYQAPREPSHLKSLPSVGRTLPHSLEAEEYLISCCLLDGADVVARCIAAKLVPDSFYDPKHGIVFEHLLALYHRQAPITPDVLAEELKTSKQLDQVGGYAFISQVSSKLPTTAQAHYFIEKVREQWVLRELIRFGVKLVEDCYGFTGDPKTDHALAELLSPKVAWIEAALSRVVHGGKGGSVTLEQRIDEVTLDVRTRSEGKENRSGYIYTGLEKFDKNLLPMGSDAEDHVVLLGGGSGHGKSAVMRQIAGGALRRQQSVLNYTRETSVKGWIRQLASNWARVDLRSLATAPKDHLQRFFEACAELREMANKKLFVFQHEPGCTLLTVEELMQHARSWSWQHGAPHLIVVDYLQLFGTEKRCNNREQEVAHVSHSLQALQRELGCVLLIGAQYNEAGLRDMRMAKHDESGKLIHRLPGPGDFRESQAMYHDADRVLALYRPPEDCRGNDQTLGSVGKPEQWICQIKRRYGGEGFTRCWFEKRFLAFEEFEDRRSGESEAPAAGGGVDFRGLMAKKDFQKKASPDHGMRKSDWRPE
jgi:replicative DNA helicase